VNAHWELYPSKGVVTERLSLLVTQPKQTSPLSTSLLLLLCVRSGGSLRDMFLGSAAAGRGVKSGMMGGAVVLYADTTHSSFRIFTLPHSDSAGSNPFLSLSLSLSHTHTHTHTHWIRLNQTPMAKRLWLRFYCI